MRKGASRMGKMIVVGNENFDESIKEDGYYVDKTELLYELVEKTRSKVSLFTRPRRNYRRSLAGIGMWLAVSEKKEGNLDKDCDERNMLHVFFAFLM